MTVATDEDFDYFYNRNGFGPHVDGRVVTARTLDYYRRKLPPKLIEYWSNFGFSGYGEGLFWMTDPDEYAEVLKAWIYSTRFHGQDTYSVVGRTAFGKLMVWGERTGFSLMINAPFGTIFPDEAPVEMSDEEGNFRVQCWLSAMQKSALDVMDDNGVPLFDRCLKQLGPVGPDEMYGFVPALGMGGSQRLDRIRKVRVVEHLMFLAQLEAPRVMLDINKEARRLGL